jgi:8-oxo-dGTP diphosphatase
MRGRVEPIGIEIIGLDDAFAEINLARPQITENGDDPLENARIKASAYYEVLRQPLFSCDSGLYIDGLEDSRQPKQNIRGIGDYMDDDAAIAHYSALAAEFGGNVTARYKNAIVLITGEGQIHEHMGDDIASERFSIVTKPHAKRNPGFPLDSLSVHIESGQYYYDMGNQDKLAKSDGFVEFFKRILLKI